MLLRGEHSRLSGALWRIFAQTKALQDAVAERRKAARGDLTTDPTTSLNTAFRAIAARAVGLDPSEELDALATRQDEDGGYSDPDCLYCFGSSTSIPLYFRSNLVTTAFAVRALAEDAPTVAPRIAGDRAWVNPIIDRVLARIL